MARIIEAKAVISAEDRTGAVFDKIANKFKGIAKGAKVSEEIGRMGKAIERMGQQAAAIDKLNRQMTTFAAARTKFREAQSEVERFSKELTAARKAAAQFDGIKSFAKGGVIAKEMAEARQRVAELERAQKRAQTTVTATARAFEREKDAVVAAKRELAGFGAVTASTLRSQAQLAASADKVAAAMGRQAKAEQHAAKIAKEVDGRRLDRLQNRRDAIGGVAAALGVTAGYKGKTIGLEAINAAGDMDYAVRYQHVATDVTEAAQRNILLPQAKRIGQETKFSNLDIVEAQTATMQSLPIRDVDLKAEVGAALVEQVRHYAVIMTAGMKDSAEGLRSFLQSTNKDISTKEKAVAEATRGTNLLVKMGKLGGMSDDDVQAFIKFGFPTGTQAGLSDTTLGAIGSVGRRSGLRGPEIGTFARAAASKLIAPTRDGREALIAAGIDYDRFTKMPGGLSAENLEKFQANRFGKTLNDSQRERLVTILENQDLTTREDFIKEVQPIIEESFGKTKKGKTKAQDASKIAKMIGDFWKLSVESTDTEGLLDAILSNPKMTAALRNAFFTDKHGGKAGVLATHLDQFREDRAALQGVANEPNFSADKSKYMTQGLGGALDNLKGGWETLVLNIGQANEGLIRFAADGLAKGTDMFSSLSTTSQQILSLVGGAAAAGGGIYGAMKFMGAVFGNGGSAAALTGSAAALDGAAGALTLAATRLGAGSLAGVAAGAAGTAGGAAGAAGAAGGAAAGAATRATVGGVVRSLGVAGVVGALGWEALKGVDYLSPSARPGYHTSPFGNAVPGRSWTMGGRGALVMPPSWGGGGLDVSGGAGAAGGSYVSNRPKTWYETVFGGHATFRGGRDTTRQQLPSFDSGRTLRMPDARLDAPPPTWVGGGRDTTRQQLPSFDSGRTLRMPDARLDASTRGPSGPVTAEVKSMPPLSGEVSGQAMVTGSFTIEPSQWFVGKFNGMEQAIIALTGKVASLGSISANGPGSTGKSSPDAGKGGRD